MLLDNALYFPLLFLDLLRQLGLIRPPGLSLLEVVPLDDLMLNLGEVFLHALHHNISMIFHEDLFKTGAAFELKASWFLTHPPFVGQVLDPDLIEAVETVEVVVLIGVEEL